MDYTMSLPLEILTNIFEFLSGSDHAASRQTCKRWYKAASVTSFLRKKCVTFRNEDGREPDLSILKMFEESDLSYSSYCFHNLDISKQINKFWNNVGENIRELTFEYCEIPKKADSHVLRKCLNLEILKIESCSELFMAGLLMDEGYKNIPILSKLKTLRLCPLRHNISDAVLLNYFKAAPNLQDLDLEYFIEVPSENTVTFQLILAFIVERAQNMKRISLKVNDAVLKCVSEVENLSLDILEVPFSRSLTDAGILALTSFQKNLRALNITFCEGVTDLSLISICKNLTNLEELDVSACKVTDLSVVELTQLKKLRVLNLSGCESVTSAGITNGICSKVNSTIIDLDIGELEDVDERCIINMSEKLPELRKLNCFCTRKPVTDKSIQAILKNQIWLRSLNLNHSHVSDEGLTGMRRCDLVTLDKVNKLIHSQNDYENEVVSGVELLNENISDYTISLTRLKGLIYLDLGGCDGISDISLQYALKLKELVYLDLSGCSRITHEGMGFLVINCPAIETLRLSECLLMNDEGVDTISKGLRRLKHLDLQCCKTLTDKSLESIRSHCKSLQMLELCDCKQLSRGLALSLSTHIKTLRVEFW